MLIKLTRNMRSLGTDIFTNIELITFVLSCYGMTSILVYSKIFSYVRPRHYFFHCPMCVGFWVGILMMVLSSYTELFTFEVSWANTLILGSLSSGTSYVLSMLVTDGGLQYEYRNKGSLDPEVDAQTSSKLLQG